MKAGGTIKNILQSIIQGQFVMRLKLDERFPQIVVCLVMGFVAIAFSLMIENTLIKVNRNNETLQEQKDEIALKTIELSEICNMENLEKMLKAAGSDLREPAKPAREIKKK